MAIRPYPLGHRPGLMHLCLGRVGLGPGMREKIKTRERVGPGNAFMDDPLYTRPTPILLVFIIKTLPYNKLNI